MAASFPRRQPRDASRTGREGPAPDRKASEGRPESPEGGKQALWAVG